MTTNEITVPQSEITAYEAFARETSSKMWIGTLLKFNKGNWLAGPEDKKENEIPLGTKFVAVVPSLMNGWIKWWDNKPVAHEMGSVAKFFVPVPRSSLGDNDKTIWETDPKGDRRDPWQLSNYMVMINEQEQIFTFTTASKGGRSALGELALAYSKMIPTEPNELPVVEIGKSSYKHSKASYGKILTPVFKIVDWVDAAAWLALCDAGGEAEAKPITAKPSEPKAGKKGSNIRFQK
jgi:hypothetical protein